MAADHRPAARRRPGWSPIDGAAGRDRRVQRLLLRRSARCSRCRRGDPVLARGSVRRLARPLTVSLERFVRKICHPRAARHRYAASRRQDPTDASDSDAYCPAAAAPRAPPPGARRTAYRVVPRVAPLPEPDRQRIAAGRRAGSPGEPGVCDCARHTTQRAVRHDRRFCAWTPST